MPRTDATHIFDPQGRSAHTDADSGAHLLLVGLLQELRDEEQRLPRQRERDALPPRELLARGAAGESLLVTR